MKSIGLKMVIGVLIFGAISCTKNNDTTPSQPLNAIIVSDLPADTIIGIGTDGQPYGSGKFTLYSLEQNKIIANTDSASTMWDIGFRGTTIITNSGNSGPGNGGAFIYIGLFSDLNTIPSDSTFRIDNAPTSYAIPTGSGNGWYIYDGADFLINPIPGRVLVIRTASGKYAKIEIINYYKGGVTPPASASDEEKISKQRYYTFRYIYQADGSKTF